MNGSLKKNYGFAFECNVDDEKPFYEWIVFAKGNLMDFWFNYEDMEEIKRVLKEEGWKRDGKKTYDNEEVEVIYEKNNGRKMMFYYNKEEK